MPCFEVFIEKIAWLDSVGNTTGAMKKLKPVCWGATIIRHIILK